MSKSDYYWVYILVNKHNNVMYVGFTGDLNTRMFQHKNKTIPGFTSRYNTNKLVYYEQYQDPMTAIEREKTIKKWRREKKNALVKQMNPEFHDLWESLDGDFSLRSK